MTGRDFTTKLIPNVEVLLQGRAGSRYNRRFCRTLPVAFDLRLLVVVVVVVLLLPVVQVRYLVLLLLRAYVLLSR